MEGALRWLFQTVKAQGANLRNNVPAGANFECALAKSSYSRHHAYGKDNESYAESLREFAWQSLDLLLIVPIVQISETVDFKPHQDSDTTWVWTAQGTSLCSHLLPSCVLADALSIRLL